MGDDLDDTVIVPPRHDVPSAAPDLDDTVIPVPTPTRRRIDHATGEFIGEPERGPEREPAVDAERSGEASDMFYAFRVGLSSDSILLDVPCYVGRRPSPPRISSGRAPRLVTVSSPHKEVSSTHLELRQVGASVIVSDLRSTNGSIVMIPGSVPRKLRQGESVVVSPGTLVDIGDGNILQVLPTQRRVWPAERQP